MGNQPTAASVWQQHRDREHAYVQALARQSSGSVADCLKSIDELAEEIFLELQVKRVREEARKRAAAKLADAVRAGIADAIDIHSAAFRHESAPIATETQPAPATPQPDAHLPEQVKPETKEQRQDRRLQMCIDAGLKLPSSEVGRLPDGIGAVAQTEGVTRQTFSTDVKVALARKIKRERPKPRLVSTRKH